MLSFALIACGALLTYLALTMEARSYDIWTASKNNYKKHKSNFKDKLYRPNYAVYRFHVYVLWPLVAAVGVSALAVGILRIVL